MARLHEGRKDAWEELHWDQDVGRWVGPRRDEPPSNRMRPGHDEYIPPPPPHGLLD
jgi:hypothetical protein